MGFALTLGYVIVPKCESETDYLIISFILYMTKTNKVLLALAITLSLFAIILNLLVNKQSFGSVVQGSDYHSTTTSPTFAVAPSFKLIKDGSGTLGSLVVTTAGSGSINIYDATTTTNGGIYGTTTLVKLNTATAGTYTFDVAFYTGLLVETVGAGTGTTTITYR